MTSTPGGAGTVDVPAPRTTGDEGPGPAAGRPADVPPPERGGRLRSLLQTRSLFLLAVVLVIGYLTLTPLLYLAYGTFFEDGAFTVDGFRRAYGQSGLAPMAWNSLIFSVGSALVAFVAGTFLAYVTVRTNVPFRPVLVATAMVPLIIPGLLYTISWIMLSSENVGLLNQVSRAVVGRPIFDIFSMGGMIWVEGTHTAPLV